MMGVMGGQMGGTAEIGDRLNVVAPPWEENTLERPKRLGARLLCGEASRSVIDRDGPLGPVVILRIAGAKRENCVGQRATVPIARVHSHENCAVVATFHITGVE